MVLNGARYFINVKCWVIGSYHDDINTLVKVPGVGKKTAEWLNYVTVLKPWLKALQLYASNSICCKLSCCRSRSWSLGYKPLEAQKAVAAVKALNQPILFVLLLNQWWSKMQDRLISGTEKPEDHFDRDRLHLPTILDSQLYASKFHWRGSWSWWSTRSHTDFPGLGKTTLANIIAREMGGNRLQGLF